MGQEGAKVPAGMLGEEKSNSLADWNELGRAASGRNGGRRSFLAPALVC